LNKSAGLATKGSTDNPPILTAVAAGHVTITAGDASADVTVSAVSLSIGTVIWSNPGDASGVGRIVPAVPSPTGVADVFAFQNDGTVQAITSDGITAWTANPGQNTIALPDFQGGLVVGKSDGSSGTNIFKLDGLTGQPYPTYDVTPASTGANIAVHTDGTVFAMTRSCTAGVSCTESVIGIDPIAGTQKFSVQFQIPLSTPYEVHGGIIAGDGYYYVAFLTADSFGGPSNNYVQTNHLTLLRVNSDGTSDLMSRFMEFTNEAASEESPIGEVHMITNADTGILLTLGTEDGNPPYYVTTTGTGFSAVRGQAVPARTNTVVPVLQAQDGSFVGTYYDLNASQTDMIAFDGGGNIRWVVPNETPQIATADGGFIGASGTTYDASGNATGLSSLNENVSPGWLGNVLGTAYTVNSGTFFQLAAPNTNYAATFAALQGGSASRQSTFIQQVISTLPQTSAKQLPDLSGSPICWPLPIGTPSFTPTCGNINAVELLTSASPDSIFQNFIQTFAPVTQPPPGNPLRNTI
jgi:hypothetical protein